jgi:hypothetical protein
VVEELLRQLRRGKTETCKIVVRGVATVVELPVIVLCYYSMIKT